MNELIKLGKKRTILISISILLVSIHTIYFYHIVRPEIETKKLIQQIIRFVLTFGLLYAVYKGKKWAKVLSIILFSLAILGALVAVGTLDRPFINKVPLLVMIFVYSMAILHFGFSKSYKAFFDFQNGKEKKTVQSSEKLMNAEKFWEIIAVSKTNSSGDYEKQQTELKNELLKLSAIEILEFDNKFRTLRGEIYNWDFWACAYIINGGCSDDCFSDFRGWLIGQGKEIFENAVSNIETLAELNETNEGDWEGLSYIPTDAYERKTGDDMPNGIRENFEITGKEWNEEGDDLKNKFPKLWAKFGIV
jgi:hypothetical protein